MKTIIPAGAGLPAVCLFLLLSAAGIARAQSSNTCISPLSDEFYSKYELIQYAQYVETNSSGPITNGAKPFGFNAVISLATNLTGAASNAFLTLPNLDQIRMSTNRDERTFTVAFATNAYTNIFAVFPDGTYQFGILGNTVVDTLPDGSTLPNPPTLSDYAADQAIDPTKDFTLSWNPFIQGGVFDGITVTLTDHDNGSNVFKSGDYGCPGALDGTLTSILIASNTLTTNTTYSVAIAFIKVYLFDTNYAPQVARLAGTEVQTMATIATGGGSVTGAAPVLTNAALISGGGVQFDLTTTPGLTYEIQFNQNLSNSNGWTTLLTTNAAANLVSFTNGPVSGAAAGFYRAVQK